MPEEGETGREAGYSKQCMFFNCMQTLWVSKEETHENTSPITRIMNTYMMINMCQTLDFIITTFRSLYLLI